MTRFHTITHTFDLSGVKNTMDLGAKEICYKMVREINDVLFENFKGDQNVMVNGVKLRGMTSINVDTRCDDMLCISFGNSSEPNAVEFCIPIDTGASVSLNVGREKFEITTELSLEEDDA